MAGRRVVSGAVDRKPAAAPARSTRSVRSTESSPKRSGQSDPGEFVDVRRLQGEDLVAKTLNQTRGQLGVVTRPKVVDFRARLKERRKATARVILLRAD